MHLNIKPSTHYPTNQNSRPIVCLNWETRSSPIKTLFHNAHKTSLTGTKMGNNSETEACFEKPYKLNVFKFIFT